MAFGLKTFSAMPAYVMNILGKFRSNPSAKYKDVAPREIDVNGRTDGRMYNGPKT